MKTPGALTVRGINANNTRHALALALAFDLAFDLRRPVNHAGRSEGMSSLGETPSGGARALCLLWGFSKVSRRKGGTGTVINFVFGHNMLKRCMYANQKETGP